MSSISQISSFDSAVLSAFVAHIEQPTQLLPLCPGAAVWVVCGFGVPLFAFFRLMHSVQGFKPPKLELLQSIGYHERVDTAVKLDITPSLEVCEEQHEL